MKRLLVVTSFLLSISAHAQLTNTDFESWYPDTMAGTKLTAWEHRTKYDLSNVPLYGTWQSTNSQHDTYALMLSRWYNYTWDAVKQKNATTYNPASLTGFYTYTKNDLTGVTDLDSALITIYMLRWNIATQNEDTISKGRRQLGHAGSYTFFDCPIIYSTSGQADSILVYIEPSKWAGVASQCADSNFCSFLTVDNLALTQPNAVEEPQDIRISLFPNPVQNVLLIRAESSIAELSMRTSAGALVWHGTDLGNRLELSTTTFAQGMYVVEVTDQKGKKQYLKVVKE